MAERVGRLIQDQYRERCRLGAIAGQLRTTPARLAHGFQRQYGVSMKRYQLTLRIVDAVEQLRDGKIEAIALQVGFKSRKDFNHSFEQLMGVTPSQFKRLPADAAALLVERTLLLLSPGSPT
jgi:AraC-like DNA-binding protein